jgi:hypothetical protein
MKKAQKHAQTLHGTVLRYTTNRHNDVDGMIVDIDGQQTGIRFPSTASYRRIPWKPAAR